MMQVTFTSIAFWVSYLSLIVYSKNVTTRGMRRTEDRARMIDQIHKRHWDPSLYQEVPCSDGEVQTVILRPGRAWRFQSPNFPSMRGYPESLECTWRFRAENKAIGNVQITCDHFDVDGNFFQSCKDADWIAARHTIDNDYSNGEVHDDEKLCGDLTSWIPLSAHWHKPKDTRYFEYDVSYQARDVHVKFSSNRRNTATGFSCRIVGLKADEEEVEPTAEPAPTTTTEAATTTLGPGECPGPDENYCSCGRIKEVDRPWPWPFPLPQLDDNKIVGGQEAQPHAYPWQVALTYYDYQFCGGSLITKRHVLTAAHCTDYLVNNDYEKDEFKVTLSDHDLTTDEDCSYGIIVKNIFAHPDYGQINAFDSDFSILELEYPVDCSDYVSPVCLPSDIGNDYANAKAKVTGWGTLNPDTGEVPDVLYEVSVQTLSNYDCQEESQYDADMITETMLCAGEDGKDSCWGDSGGPLIINEDGKYTLVGVVSWGYGCAMEGYPGVYARVTSVMPWIKEIVGSYL